MARYKHKKRKLRQPLFPQPKKTSVISFPGRYSPMRGRNYPVVDDVPNPVEDMTARQYDDGVLTVGVWRAHGTREYIDFERCGAEAIKLFLEGI